jgi:hypothetical protein
MDRCALEVKEVDSVNDVCFVGLKVDYAKVFLQAMSHKPHSNHIQIPQLWRNSIAMHGHTRIRMEKEFEYSECISSSGKHAISKIRNQTNELEAFSSFGIFISNINVTVRTLQ